MFESGIQFRNENHTSPYPFSDTASLKTKDGLTLPREVFLDALLMPVGDFVGLRLTSIESLENSLKFTVGTSAVAAVATGTFEFGSTAEVIELRDAIAGRYAGVLVVDLEEIPVLFAWDFGVHELAKDAAEFVASVCRPMPVIGVSEITLPDDQAVSGDVWIVGERGLAIVGAPMQEYVKRSALVPLWVQNQVFDADDPASIVQRDISAIGVHIVGDPLFKRAECGSAVDSEGNSRFAAPTFIKTINGVYPTDVGCISILVMDQTVASVMRIVPQGGDVLQIELAGKKVAGS